jgi:sugar transferase (PEP-CTERM/EpsH1 system associated)
MKTVLFLAHRIPYPPDKGDKIRSFHLLKHLSESYRVHLGAFVDDPRDWRFADQLRRYCGELCLLPLRPAVARLRSLAALANGAPLTVPYYFDARMAAWVDRLIGRTPVSAALAFSSAMALYLADHGSLPRIIDFVDVDSDKWRQYAERKPWPLNRIYGREARCLLRFDRTVALAFDHALFVSAREAELFGSLAPDAREKISVVENGVDTAYFSDRREHPDPYPAGGAVLVFTGAMDYWANVDAVTWFAGEVFPHLRRCLPAARFYIVGARPTAAVRRLAREEGVTVTGAVADVRPYLQHARLAVAPLRVARGVQNKVLEAMAMGKPVLATSAALQGIETAAALDVLAADRPEDWFEFGIGVLSRDLLPARSALNREFVARRYGWDLSFGRLQALLERT